MDIRVQDVHISLACIGFPAGIKHLLPNCSPTHSKTEQRDLRHAVLKKVINQPYVLLPWQACFFLTLVAA
ncbi:MAG: hypothetical protein V8R27_03845 [Oscillospiraceae bacterium]